MRKRRRLANKMTIMVCAVLIAVSAFFYVPMEVSASGDFYSSGTITNQFYAEHFVTIQNNVGTYALDSNAFDDLYYDVDLDLKLTFDSVGYPKILNVMLADSHNSVLTPVVFFRASDDGGVWAQHQEFTFSGSVILKGSLLKNLNLDLFADIFGGSTETFSLDYSLDIDVNSITPLSGADSEQYEQGYNAGYSAGETAGYGNGYSQGFTDGETSVDTDAIYDEAYQAGKDSVDTQSYYDAGYNAGYQVAYSEGYESGYDVGYQSAMDRIASWGADTSEYPLEISSGNTNAYFSVHVGSEIPFNYRDSDHWFSSKDYNPNHTYKYVINFSNIDEGLDSDILYDYWDIYLNIGGIEYNITPFQDMSVSVFIPGDRISTSYSFDWVLYNCANYVADDSNLAYLYVDYDFVIYDMGPSGDTQNHIANQTDQLTNGYDDSKGNQVNSDLSTGLNEYETAENSLFATATTGMRDFTFFDFESVPAMITGMSFIGSIMGSWFNQAGGASGVGIVLSILFSVILVAMVLGLYRWYQSRGGKN